MGAAVEKPAHVIQVMQSRTSLPVCLLGGKDWSPLFTPDHRRTTVAEALKGSSFAVASLPLEELLPKHADPSIIDGNAGALPLRVDNIYKTRLTAVFSYSTVTKILILLRVDTE